MPDGLMQLHLTTHDSSTFQIHCTQQDGEEEELVDDDALLAPEDKAAVVPKYPGG